jgi:predicted nucleic acid-binding protein
MSLALEFQHPIYDCFYLAAAIQKDTYVVTANRQLFEKARRQPGLIERVKLLNG